MVRLLPEPCVCQTRPRRQPRGLSSLQRTLHQFVGAAELLPASHLLDALPLLGVEDDEVAQDVEQVGPVAEAVDAALQLVVAVHMAVRIRAAPRLPVVKLHAGHAVAQGDLVHAHAEDVRVIELRRFAEVAPALPRAFGPVHMPVAGRGLGLDVHQRDAVDEEQHIGADAMVAAIHPELIRGEEIVVRRDRHSRSA